MQAMPEAEQSFVWSVVRRHTTDCNTRRSETTYQQHPPSHFPSSDVQGYPEAAYPGVHGHLDNFHQLQLGMPERVAEIRSNNFDASYQQRQHGSVSAGSASSVSTAP